MPNLTLPSGARLAYREIGAGPPLVLIHGSPGDGRVWSHVAPSLAARYRVLMPDLPGYGGSDPLPAGFAHATAAMASAVVALIATCDRPARLCGHSYGGNVALHAALGAGKLVRDLALFEPVFFRAVALVGDNDRLATATTFFTRYAKHVTGGQPERIADMIGYWFGEGAFDRLPEATRAFLIQSAPKNGPDVRAALGDPLGADDLANFRSPVLVAYGEASNPIAGAIAAALARLLGSARLIAIPGAGHGMLDTHSESVVATILAD